MARTQTEIRTALKGRPPTAFQVFSADAAVIRPNSDFYVSFANFGDRVHLVESFEQRPALKAVLDTFTASVAAAEMVAAMIANRNFSVGGTNMTTALCTFDAEGWLKLTTANANNDQGILWPSLSTNQSAWTAWTWGTDQQTEWGVILKTGSAITAQKIAAKLGLTSALDISTDNDQVGVKYDTGGATSTANWVVFYSIGGTDVEVDTGIAVAADTAYDIRILIDDARIARVYIDRVLVATTLALTDAVNLIPYVGIQALTGAAKHFKVRKQAIGRLAA